MVTTNCLTGRANYLSEKENYNRLIRIAKASSSLPYVCPVVIVDREPMLDGGIVDSIPVERAMSLGYERNVVVLTRNRGYRKTAGTSVFLLYYRAFPVCWVRSATGANVSNRQLD